MSLAIRGSDTRQTTMKYYTHIFLLLALALAFAKATKYPFADLATRDDIEETDLEDPDAVEEYGTVDEEETEELDKKIDQVDFRNLTIGKVYKTADGEVFSWDGEDENGKNKRQMGCGINGVTTKYKVLKHKTYWSKFKQVTGAHSCKNDPAGGAITFSQSWTKGSSVSASVGISWEKVVTLMGQVGYSVDKSKTIMIGNTCNCKGKVKKACVYSRAGMVWGKVAKRKCPVNTCNGDVVYSQCGKWQAQKNTMPLKKRTYEQTSCEVNSKCK